MSVKRQHVRQEQDKARATMKLSANGRIRIAVLMAMGFPLYAGMAPRPAQAASFGSSAWFASASSSASAGAAASTSGAAATPGSMAAAIAASRVVVPAAALAKATSALTDLTQAISGIQQAQLAQTAAANAVVANTSVPNGLTAGGLQANTSNPANCATLYTCNWQNASVPVSSTDANGTTTVTVTQTAQKAVLTWNSFNIGQKTVLDFDQSAGTQSTGANTWIALNRVAAGSSPSQILGKIYAQGSVYIIDPNGIIFGTGSQVSVTSLLASSLPLFLSGSGNNSLIPGSDPAYLAFSNEQFFNKGILAPSGTGNVLGIGSGGILPQSSNLILPGDITVEAGADINIGSLGYGLLAAPNITNAGEISATEGQIVLAAGLGVSLNNQNATSQTLSPSITGALQATGGGDATPLSVVDNTGLIEADRGNIDLLGGAISQAGVVATTTSVSIPGGIVMDASEAYTGGTLTGSLVLAPGSVTSILPDSDGETTTSSPSATTTFVPGSMSLSGGAVTLKGNALIDAPGQSVKITAIAENDGAGGQVVPDFTDNSVAGRLYLDSGATIDVAGLANVELPMADTLVTIPRLGLNELADSPLQRDGILFGASIVIDDRISGTRADGLSWVGTPVADLAGYVQAVPQSILQLLQNGGNISLSGYDVIAQTGSSLNLNGGYIHYLGGSIQTTELIAADGTLVNIADANPDEQYVAIAGQFVNGHARWNDPSDYVNPILSGNAGGAYESDYIQGGNAGTLTVVAQGNSFLEGSVTAAAVAGRHQVANGTDPSGGTLIVGGDPSGLYPGQELPGAGPSFVVASAEPTLPTGFDASTLLPSIGSTQGWTTLSTAMVANGGFSSVDIKADTTSGITQGGQIVVDPGVTLAVQPGTKVNATTGAVTVTDGISLIGSTVTVEGDLSAPSGTISIEGTGHTFVTGSTVYSLGGTDPVPGDITIASTAVLDTSGQWVNDSGLGQDQISGGAFVNGGSINITTIQNSSASPITKGYVDDTTGSINLQAGSLLNVSSGGRILQSGALAANSSGIPLGQGGSIALETYVPESGGEFGPGGGARLPGVYSAATQVPLSSGTLTLDGTLLGYGFDGGGTLSLRALGIQIGGSAPQASSDCNCNSTLTLPASFFEQTGFGTISLQAEYNATIAPNTILTLSQYNLLPNLSALQQAGTGTNILGAITGGSGSSYVSVGQLDSYHRSPVNFDLYGGDYANWQTGTYAIPTYAAADNITGTLLDGADSQIVADPGASIILGSDTQVTIDGSITAHGGSITLTGDTGNGGYAQLPGSIPVAYSSPTKSVWLDSAAVLDVSGVALVNPLASPATAAGGAAASGSANSSAEPGGEVLAGGTVTVTDDTGYVIMTNCMDTGSCTTGETTTLLTAKNVAVTDANKNPVSVAVGTLPATTINVSGATGTLMEPTGTNGAVQATTVQSSAGTIRIGAGEGTYLHANLEGFAGGDAPTSLLSSTTDGGTLYVTPEVPASKTYDSFGGAVGMTIGAILPNTSLPLTFGPGQTVALTEPPVNSKGGSTTNGQLYFSPDLLFGSGITSLHLGSDPTLNAAASTLPITFTYVGVYKGTTTADLSNTTSAEMGRDDSINISLGAALYLNASDYVANTFIGPTANAVAEPISVGMSAPYVSISGLESAANYPNTTDPNPGISKSTFSAYASGGMDLGGQFFIDNFSSVSLSSQGDIRLVTPSQYGYYVNPVTDSSTAVPGALETSGALNLDAAQIYPATGNTFIFLAADAQNTAGTTNDTKANPNGTAPITVTPGSITISQNGASPTVAPLSAGGTLIFDTPTIVQDGTVVAPDGQIYLGVSNQPYAANLATYQNNNGATDTAVYDSLAESLLVYDVAGPKSTTTQVSLPVIPTNLVTLGGSSVTSTSLNGATVPYGTTVDGQNLVYNGSGGTTTSVTISNSDLTTAPTKLVSINSAQIQVSSGATVNLSGGGDLQAQEWVAGTGGSRNVLSAVNTSYTTGTALQVPLYADGRPVYAVIPGYTDPLGAYDPELTSSPLVGKSVYLSGIAGLPAGFYTLLPAQYATLPGAFRVVQDTSTPAFQPVNNQVLVDGTDVVAGYFVDSLTGAKGNPEAFQVQSGAVWQQYSQYQLTSLNQYFGTAAEAKAGAYMPEDAGQLDLSLNPDAYDQAIPLPTPEYPSGLVPSTSQNQNANAASGALTLPTLITTAPAGASGAELDIAAPLIEVADSSVIPSSDALVINPLAIDSLNIGRLVLGGISTRSIVRNPASGNNPQGSDTIVPIATEVDIDTPQVALQAPEIVAVSQTQVQATQNYDSKFNTIYNILSDKSGQGVVVNAGSQIIASGSYNSALDLPISIGLLPSSDVNGNLADVINGDGSLLRVSVGNPVTVSRVNVPGVDAVSGTAFGVITTDSAGGPEGIITIDKNASISATGSVLVNSSGSATIDPSVQLSTPVFAADSSSITLRTDVAYGTPTGLVLTGSLINELSSINDLILNSSSVLNFDGNITINSGGALELSAGTFASDGGTTTINVKSLMLANDLGGNAATPATGSGVFTANVSELDLGNNNINDLGSGAISFTGFSNINVNASSAVVARGEPNAFNFGAASVALNTPLLAAATGSNVSLTTTGAVAAQNTGGTALALSSVDNVCLLVDAPAECQTPAAALSVGGGIAITGNAITLNTQVAAPAGKVSLDATQGNLNIGSAAGIDVAGVARPLYDAEQVAGGGSIDLTAAAGQISIALNASSGLDIAGVGGGSGGSLNISAPAQNVTLAANINYTGGSSSLNGSTLTRGQGGSFSLNAGGGISLDSLAAQLADGGIDGAVSIRSESGNLTLDKNYTLTGSSVSLIADGGTGLNDKTDGNLTVAGEINAAGSTAGSISLFGSSNVNVTGSLLANATGAGQNGGTIAIGTTGTGSGGFNSTYGYELVNASNSGAITLGSGAVLNVAGGQGGSGGIVDLRAPLLAGSGSAAGGVNITAPVSVLNSTGARDVTVEAYATWSTTDNVGNANLQFDGIIDPAGAYTSTGALSVNGSGKAVVNTSHANFYTGTLMDFVQTPGFTFTPQFAGVTNFNARAGIDLVNPSTSINGGAISVLSDWNLGAGSVATNGSLQLDYRTGGTVAPVLSLLAVGNVNVAASLSDGFFQSQNPFDVNNPGTDLNNSAAPVGTANNPLPLITASLVSEDSSSYRIVAGANLASSDPLQLAAAGTSNITLSGDESSVSNSAIDNGLIFVAPTMIRTGVGSISLAATGNIALTNASAPGVIYTAGTPAAGTTPGAASSAVITTITNMPIFIDTGDVNPVLGGNLSLFAGGNITGITTVVDSVGNRTGVTPNSTTGVPATDLTQYWWPWMQDSCVISGCAAAATSSSINFGMFDQGIMSVGGNVQVTAGNNITDLSVSLPTTWAINNGALQVYGGGNLTLTAGGNLASGSIFVSDGTGTVKVGGAIGSDSYFSNGGSGDATVIGLQNAEISVQSGGNADIGGIYDPSYLFPGFDEQTYSASSSVSLTSLAGNLTLGNEVAIPGASFGANNGVGGLVEGSSSPYIYVLPATLNLDALGGGINIARQGELYPSATGNLSLLSTGDINLDDLTFYQEAPISNTYFGLIDAPASLLDNPLNPDASGALSSFLNPEEVLKTEGVASYLLHSATPLHANDTQPMQIYSADGDIIDGEAGENFAGALVISADKPAEIHAGRDLVDLSFYGQNLYSSDVTLLEANRDFYDAPLAANLAVPVIELGGPGALDIIAGRNLGPITSVNQASDTGYLRSSPAEYPGIFTVGNLLNAYLPEAGASIDISFGVGGGFNTSGIASASGAVGAGFAAQYLDPSTDINASIGLPSYGTTLLQDVLQYELDLVSRAGANSSLTLYKLVASSGTPSVSSALLTYQGLSATGKTTWLDAAYADFTKVLPQVNQQALEATVLYDILNQVGLDETTRSSPYYQQYGRGYAAINTLFPPALGYTANSLGTGVNGAQSVVQTGTFDMRGSTVQTQRGGDVNILGPGGSVLVGSQSAPPEVASSGITPDTQGILTLESGAINILTDESVLLAQSRIFTEQGGDMMIWSSNGDINAGKGAKTSSEVPPPEYYCDPDHYCEVDSRSQVSGAGIGVLQTKPDTPTGSANLIAPHGTVDAGDAGIRVSGNLNVAAAHVANANNISTGGKEVGVPTGATDTAALSAGMTAGNSATQSSDPCAGGNSESANCPSKKGHEAAASQLEVEVMGYGGGE